MVVVTVGRIGRAHGVRGEVTVDVRTDAPEDRFAEGSVLATEPARVGPLTVRRARWHSGSMLVQFESVEDRDAAEALRGTTLVAEIAADEATGDPDEFFDHQLVDLRVVTVAGDEVGTVREVVHGVAQDLLVVVLESGREAFVPFVGQIVPDVDIAAGRLVIDPPPGLLNPDEVEVAAAAPEQHDPGTDSR